MRTTVIRSLLATVALASAACSGGSGTNAPPPVNLEVDSWWTTAQLPPIQAVINLHEAAFPNVTVNVVTAADQATMDTNVTHKFAAGSPPAAFQANLGATALQFAQSALALTPSWTSNFSQSVLDTLTANGKLIGAPLGLTRQNAAYWNLKAMATLTPPLNTIPVGLQAFQDWITGVAAAGYKTPLCFGFADGWVNAHILFEDVVPAVKGKQFSHDYWTGHDTTAGQGMVDAITWAKTYIQPYITADTATNKMGPGVDRLMATPADMTQQCFMTAMGDWGGARLQASPNSFVVGTQASGAGDFQGGGFPGAEDVVVFGGDAMVAAKGTGSEADVTAFFDTMASEAAQLKFATLKNEMPARNLTAADIAKLPPLIQANVAALANTDPTKGGVGGFKVIGKQPIDYNNNLYTQAQQFFLSGDPAALLAYMTQNYSQTM
jgi:hypothetical protein